MVALHCINPLDYERGCRIFVVCSWGYRHRATKLAKNSIPKFPISLCATDAVIITVWRAGPCWRGWGGGWPAGARLGTAGPPAHRGHCHRYISRLVSLHSTVPARQRSRRRARGCGRRDGGGGDARTCTIARINQHKLGYYQEWLRLRRVCIR